MKLYELICNGRLLLPPEFSPELRNFISSLLAKEVKKRIGCLKNGVNDIKTHPYLAKVDWSSILDRSIVPPFVPKTKGPGDHSQFEYFEEVVLEIAEKDVHSKIFDDFWVEILLPV